MSPDSSSLVLEGLTQDDYPLSIQHILWRAKTLNRGSEVVTIRDADGTSTRTSLGEVAERAARLSSALEELGVKAGDRVGTLAWNSQEHLELYYAVTCMGAVVHTINPRLHEEDIAWIADHASDMAIVFDIDRAAQVEAILPHVKTIEHVIAIGEGDLSNLPGALRYEQLVESGAPDREWPEVDERAAASLCYTSGTTGKPKGVLYSHRAVVLHALLMMGCDTFQISRDDRILAVVPMFHSLGWNLPFTAGMSGADIVMPTRYLQAPHLARIIATEGITYGSGVPTVLMDLLHYADEHETDLSSLRIAPCGGTAVPRSLMEGFEDRHGVKIVQGWGMTEMLAGTTMAHDRPGDQPEERWAHRTTAGRLSPLTEARVMSADGEELPWNGVDEGELQIRGPITIGEYYRNPEASKERFDGSWLLTGDIATLTPDGWLRITDRIKDVIKSGGEWISSVDLENELMGHPAVREAAVIGQPDERWTERPLACVALASPATASELRLYLADRVAKWWLPDDFAFLDELPRTSVGKFDKKALRALLDAGELPTGRPES